MPSIRHVVLTVATMLALVSCNRDPNVTKARYLDSGNKYFARERYKEASIQYRNAIKIDARYGSAHYRLGLTYLKLEEPDFARAVQEFRRAIELIPVGNADHWDAVVKITEIYLSPIVTHDEQLLKEVKAYCDALLQRDGNSYDGHRLTGDYYYIQAVEAAKVKSTDVFKKNLDAALGEYKISDGLKPGQQGVVMQIARSLTLGNDLAGAEQRYRAVIDKDKAYLEGYRELYTLLWYQNRRPEAEALLKAGYAANPKQYRYLIWLAEQYAMEQRRDDMLKVLQQLKSKAGEYDRAYFDVGDFYLRVGEGDSAIREYRDGITKDAKNKATYQKRIIEALLRQGKRAEAAEINSQILKENPGDNDARGMAAALLLEKGDVSKAMTELQQVVTHAPTNPVAHYNLGRAYFLHGDAEQAHQEFQKAIELRPDYTAARVALAQMQVSRGEFDAALTTAKDILKYDPNNANAKLIESASLMGQKKFSDSREMLNAMLKANPSSPDTLFQLGVVNLAENKFQDAEDAFRRSYELNPANTRGLMGVIETYMSQNKNDQAIQVLQGAAVKEPARMDFHLALGNIAVRSGRWDLAISEYQKVLAVSEKGSKSQGEMYLRIGETQRRKNDVAGAIGSLQAARQTLP